MLTEKRYELILKLLDEQNSVTVAEIKEKLKISESTIRRDLNALDKAGKLNKVFGGAVAIEAGITTAEPSVAQKKGVNKEEKQLIARYAAALITKDDFVYLDAGTTTGCMIDFITEKSATYVTNAVSHAQKLAAAGFRVYLIGGEFFVRHAVHLPVKCNPIYYSIRRLLFEVQTRDVFSLPQLSGVGIFITFRGNAALPAILREFFIALF